jgi:hypothetical protein
MSEELARYDAGTAKPAKASVINALASKLECDPAKLMPMLKKTAFSTCRSDEEFMAMCIVANTYDLNPILKEIYAFPSKSGAVVPIVSVDGWIKLMNRDANFDGIEFEEADDHCTAIIYRKDRSHPTKATEWLAECMGTTEPWKRWPKRMLRHKAMIQAARLAFGYGGIYDEDEGRRIASVEHTTDYTVSPAPTPEPKPECGASKLRKALKMEKAKPEAAVELPPRASEGQVGKAVAEIKAKIGAAPTPEPAPEPAPVDPEQAELEALM